MAGTGTFEIGRDGPGVVVVGVDGSSTSRDALAYALGMARREGSQLIVVQVKAPVATAAAVAAAGGTVLPADLESDQLDPAVTTALEELLPGRWVHQLREGEPGAELEKVARESQADAIVVGRSRNPNRHLLGSVAARLVRHATHPVIVVP